MPETADLRILDGSDEAMFPLLTAQQVGDRIGFSPAWVHQLWDSGGMPYVLWEHGSGEGNPATERRNRRMRSDHLLEEVRKRTVEAVVAP